MEGVPQPGPITSRYNSREVAAWRASVGVSQQEVADFLKVKQPYIARIEGDETMSLDAGRRVIYAVYRRLGYRERMVRNGQAELAAIREGQAR